MELFCKNSLTTLSQKCCIIDIRLCPKYASDILKWFFFKKLWQSTANLPQLSPFLLRTNTREALLILKSMSQFEQILHNLFESIKTPFFHPSPPYTNFFVKKKFQWLRKGRRMGAVVERCSGKESILIRYFLNNILKLFLNYCVLYSTQHLNSKSAQSKEYLMKNPYLSWK